MDLVPLDPYSVITLWLFCLALDCCLFVYAGISLKVLDG